MSFTYRLFAFTIVSAVVSAVVATTVATIMDIRNTLDTILEEVAGIEEKVSHLYDQSEQS